MCARTELKVPTPNVLRSLVMSSSGMTNPTYHPSTLIPWRRHLNKRCTKCSRSTSTHDLGLVDLLVVMFLVMPKWVGVFTGHPGVSWFRPAVFAEFFLPPFGPTSIEPVDVQRGIEMIKFVLQNACKPTVGFKIYGLTVDIKTLKPH